MSDLRLSVSKTKTFKDCKKKYHYVYILKMPRKEFEYHTLGKFCHSVLENYYNAIINGSENSTAKEMSIAWKKAMDEYKEKITPEIKQEAKDMIQKYLFKKNEFIKNKQPLPKVLKCEKSFNLDIGENVILNGFIDKVQIDPDGILHVADYKTTKNKKYLKNDWLQLLTYCYVLLEEDPSLQVIRGSYILLRHDFEHITKDFTREEILETKQKYIEIANNIRDEKEYTANPTILCNWCEFVDICPDAFKKKQQVFGEVTW